MASMTSLLADSTELAGESTAILAPGRKPLSFRQLTDLITETVGQLNRLGIGRGGAQTRLVQASVTVCCHFLKGPSRWLECPLPVSAFLPLLMCQKR